MDEFEYDADQELEEEEEELGMSLHGKNDLESDDIEYVGLIWNGSSLALTEGSTSTCLDLSKTYGLPMNAFNELSTQAWEHLRFNLTDNSVFTWMDSNKKIQKGIKEIIVCLPEPRGFEIDSFGSGNLKPKNLRRFNRSSSNRKKRKHRRAASTVTMAASDRGIEGFLRRGVEQFSFQTTLTTWFQGLDQFLKNTRPGPFWWPAKTASIFCDREERFLGLIDILPNLHNITVIMGPCSRMGYKNLDSLMLKISKIRKNISFVLQYVDENGFEDAYLHAKDCDYEISNNMSSKYEEFEAIRRVDGTSLQFFEWPHTHTEGKKVMENHHALPKRKNTIITSVDPGSTNCGFAKYSVKQDRFLLFDLADLRTSRAGDVVDALHTYATSTNPESFSGTTLVVVERQMGMNARNMCIEASLRSKWWGRCVCVAPQKVMTHFGISSGTPRPIKKKKMVELTRKLLTSRENAMVEEVIETRRAANRLARKDFKERLAKAKSKKRKRLPKLKLPYPKIKYDDVLEAAAQAIWAAEDLLGHKVKRRRRRHKKKKIKKVSKQQTKLQDIWRTSPPQNSSINVSSSAAVIIID